MSESPTPAEAASWTGFSGNLRHTRTLLRIVYGVVPIVAGLDKFTNVLTTWTAYLPEAVTAVLPVESAVFMYLVGAIEITAGGVVLLTRRTAAGAAVVAAWLTLVALTQLLAGNYTIAVRDLVMAVGALALVQLSLATLDR